MSQSIVECIPNFSEGRRPEVIEAIVEAVQSVGAVSLLDSHSDPDHNRTVLTFVGPPDPVAEAAFLAIRVAAEQIDLEVQEGEHPRIGATDVVPFVPISGVTMEECIQLAHQLGKRVGQELGIPVYLYERAATRPERVNLEQIRKGEYEALKETIRSNPDRKPDYGPSELGSAGATVIGARPPLIAYNVYLTTDQVEIAQKIARVVRYSSGGLRYVKALGMLVDGQAQVSMNLTDYTRTPVFRVVDLIRREAARYGVSIDRSELVGMIPQGALIDTAVWHLQLDDLQTDQILENRLYSMQLGVEDASAQFLSELASDTPTPGGGSAAAYAGAMGAALVEMVARLTTGKKRYAEVEARMVEIASEAADLRTELLAKVNEDAAAFEAVMQAYHLPKSGKDAPQREAAIQEATLHAAEVPLAVASAAVVVLKLAAEVARDGNLNAISDAGAAGSMAGAALHSAALNVQINVQSLTDPAVVKRLQSESSQQVEAGAEAHRALLQALEDRSNLHLPGSPAVAPKD